MVHFGPFWPEEVHFGPFRSANRTLAIPDKQKLHVIIRAGRVEGDVGFSEAMCWQIAGSEQHPGTVKWQAHHINRKEEFHVLFFFHRTCVTKGEHSGPKGPQPKFN